MKEKIMNETQCNNNKSKRELKQLTPDELKTLHTQIVGLRKLVLDVVQEYNYDANSLVSKTFQHDVEQEYGRKKLKELAK